MNYLNKFVLPHSLIYECGFVLQRLNPYEWEAIVCFNDQISIHKIYEVDIVWANQEIRQVLKLETLSQCERKILWHLYHAQLVEDNIAVEDDSLIWQGCELHINQLRRNYQCREFLKMLGYPIISL